MSSYFDRARVRRLMRKFGLTGPWLHGDNRARQSTVRFETMRTLRSPVDYFSKAMDIELEHGSVNPATDVTHDSALHTARIAAAHLLGVEADEPPEKWRPFAAYYDALIHMEKNIRV